MNNICKKSIVISIILLLIGVSVSSAISVDTKSTISNNQSDECSECQEVSKSDLIRVERLLDRVEVYSKLLLVFSRFNPELREMSEELSNRISTLKTFDLETDICLWAIEKFDYYTELTMHYRSIQLYYEKKGNLILSEIYNLISLSFAFIMLFYFTITMAFDCWDWPDY